MIISLSLLITACSGQSGEQIGRLRQVSGMTVEQELEANKILGELETGRVTNVERYEKKDKNGKQAFTVKLQEGDVLLVYLKDNNLSTVMLDGTILYSDGKIKKKYTDIIMTSDNAFKYISASEKIIEKILKSPSTAKFPSYHKWGVGFVKGDKIATQSYVDSQNSFGATIRSEFQVTFTKDGTVTSLIFDGKEFIK